MPDSPAVKAKVLFVDDDLSFLQMIRDVLGDASGGAWDIQTATGGGDAMRRLRAARLDLAVIDVYMPVLDGLQLLRLLNEEFPSLPKVLLTGMPDANTRAAALEGGAALFLEKPTNAAGYASIFATLNELLRWHQRFSKQGALRRLDLIDLVRLECKSGNSRMFEVFVGDMRGEIYVKDGDITHATMPDRRGQSAFTYLTTTPGAVFYLRQFVDPNERSITRQWEFLVMEAAQMLEQIAQSAIASSPRNVVAPAAVPPPSPQVTPPAPARPPVPAAAPAVLPTPAPVPPPATPKAAPVQPAPIPFSPPPPKAAPAAPPAPAKVEFEAQPEPAWTIAEAPDARPMDLESDPAGLKVEEMLLCSEFREVLFESRCPDTQKRLHLGEGIWSKANELSRSLPLGELDRAEMQSSGSRLVLRYEAKRCLLVRTNTKSRPPSPNPGATEAAEEWLDRQPLMRGVLAASVMTNDARIHFRSFVPDYSKDVLQVASRDAARLLDVAMRFAFPAWQVRLLFTRSQLYTFRRHDGLLLSVFLLREGLDLAGTHRFFDEFKQVRAA